MISIKLNNPPKKTTLMTPNTFGSFRCKYIETTGNQGRTAVSHWKYGGV